MKSASAESDARGNVSPVIAVTDLPESQQNLRGVQLGIYKIEVNHPQRALPKKYNTITELGCEIPPEPSIKPPVIKLSLR